MTSSYKIVARRSSVDSLLDASEIEELASEMEEWRDGMSGTSLESTEKYNAVDEAADTLRDTFTELESQIDDLRNLLDERTLKTEVQYVERELRYKRRSGPSRDVRVGNWISGIRAVLDYLTEAIKPDVTEVHTSIDSITSLTEDLEGIEFPGMYS